MTTNNKKTTTTQVKIPKSRIVKILDQYLQPKNHERVIRRKGAVEAEWRNGTAEWPYKDHLANVSP